MKTDYSCIIFKWWYMYKIERLKYYGNILCVKEMTVVIYVKRILSV